MDLLHRIADVLLHLDVHLKEQADALGPWTYVLLFAIVFCETGLVVTPFLPGDSLLFAVGALAASDAAPIGAVEASLVLFVAAVLGDAVNYRIGKLVGPKVFARESSRLLKREHMDRTRRFYAKYGGKTIVIARFVPIVRTFAPFVAGVGRMDYRRFAFFNVAGAILWVVGFVSAGYAFGNLPLVKQNFHIAILAIIALSLVPPAIEYVRARRSA